MAKRKLQDRLKPKSSYKAESPIQLGNPVFIRSVTHYYTGRIGKITRDEIVLMDAAWIADTGRFSQALESGALCEVEPFPFAVSVGRGAIIDVTYWPHALPRGVK